MTREVCSITRTNHGLNRLIGAVESPGSSYRYAYDLVGNRTDVWVDGTRVEHRAYDAANQVVGWSYDAAGNLLNDGTTSYTYDALNRLTRLTQGSTTTYQYNGDGVLVTATQGGTTTHSAQDLVAPLSQVLQLRQDSSTTSYVHGHARLVARSGITQTWYDHDALGSVRQTLDGSGTATSAFKYDPWGVPRDGATPPTFGFTGELQEPGGLVYLRARWYQPQQGRFLSKDPFQGFDHQPASLHGYQYAYHNPILLTDPSGQCIKKPQGLLEPEPGPGPTGLGIINSFMLELVMACSQEYGVPWQVVGGLLESELQIDTELHDRPQDEVFRSNPQLAFWISRQIDGGDNNSVGIGLGNIHLPLARTVGEYMKLCYDIGLPDFQADDYTLARTLAHDEPGIRYVAAIVRYLADYRFGSNGRPKTGNLPNISEWKLTDGVAIWHAYRYGINRDISPPDGQGFPRVADYQNRNLTMEQLIARAAGNDKENSMRRSIPIFMRYFAER